MFILKYGSCANTGGGGGIGGGVGNICFFGSVIYNYSFQSLQITDLLASYAIKHLRLSCALEETLLEGFKSIIYDRICDCFVVIRMKSLRWYCFF